jgi:hypothetical protein
LCLPFLSLLLSVYISIIEYSFVFLAYIKEGIA